ncbi:hypothetical protein WJX72_009304 [[Myrmecia] bisecta]|uniref:Transmembrane protein n=1 Tax=[Myrmecia] bisecta TaxID=41462 RepID=A0AAW1R902_9CHLO
MHSEKTHEAGNQAYELEAFGGGRTLRPGTTLGGSESSEGSGDSYLLLLPESKPAQQELTVSWASKPADQKEACTADRQSWELDPFFRASKHPRLLRRVDAFARPWRFVEAAPDAVSWLVGMGFFAGGALFVFSNLGEVVFRNTPGNGMRDAYDWCVLFPPVIGTLMFIVACFCQVVEAANRPPAAAVFPFGGPQEHLPKWTWFGLRLRSAEWWAALMYFVGCLMFETGSVVMCLHEFPSLWITPHLYNILVNYVNGIAGVLFFIPGLIYSAIQGNGITFCSMFIPMSKDNLTCMSWWVNWLNLWGGMAFCAAGFALTPLPEVNQPTHESHRLSVGIGYSTGSMCFAISGFLSLILLSERRCTRRGTTNMICHTGSVRINHRPSDATQLCIEDFGQGMPPRALVRPPSRGHVLA